MRMLELYILSLNQTEKRQLITIRQAADMAATTFSTRDKAIIILLLKLGFAWGN